MVVPFTDVEKDGVLHNGFDIVVQGEIADFVKGRFKAKKLTDNEVLVEMPSASNSYLNHLDNFFENLKRFRIHCNRAQLGHEVARNAILDDDARMTKRLVLRFPEYIILSAHQYTDSTGNLSCELIPCQSEFFWQERTITQVHDYILWKVAIQEEEPRVVKCPVADESEGVAKLAAHLGSMFPGY